jgi:hypothetical protein
MNETKKRGRPSKADIAARAMWSESADPGAIPVAFAPQVSPAQAYARRVYSGCTDSMYESEKLRIVKEALDGQGLSMEGVVLP